MLTWAVAWTIVQLATRPKEGTEIDLENSGFLFMLTVPSDVIIIWLLVLLIGDFFGSH